MSNRIPGYRKWRILPSLFIMAVIFYFSNLPGDHLAVPLLFGSDKLLHFAAYGVLAASLLYALWTEEEKTARRPYVLTLIICLLYGISDEVHQSFIPLRYASVWDVVADFLGALFVVWAWRLITTRIIHKNTCQTG